MQKSKFKAGSARLLSSGVACSPDFQPCGTTQSMTLCVKKSLKCPINNLFYADGPSISPSSGGIFFI